jgi:hypothetical protein
MILATVPIRYRSSVPVRSACGALEEYADLTLFAHSLLGGGTAFTAQYDRGNHARNITVLRTATMMSAPRGSKPIDPAMRRQVGWTSLLRRPMTWASLR